MGVGLKQYQNQNWRLAVPNGCYTLTVLSVAICRLYSIDAFCDLRTPVQDIGLSDMRCGE